MSRGNELLQILRVEACKKAEIATKYDRETREWVSWHFIYFKRCSQEIPTKECVLIKTPKDLIAALNRARRQGDTRFLSIEEILVLPDGRKFKIIDVYLESADIPKEEIKRYQTLSGINFWDLPPGSLLDHKGEPVEVIPALYLVEPLPENRGAAFIF